MRYYVNTKARDSMAAIPFLSDPKTNFQAKDGADGEPGLTSLG
jgi:hypothetical protein